MANNDDSLIREVEEELRRERMQDLWNRYGTYFLVAAIALLAAVAGFNWYKQSRSAAATAAGAQFDKALVLVEQSKTAEAIAAFSEIAKSGPAGYAALARLQMAAAYVKSGDKAKAIETLEALAGSSSADPTLKSLASLQLATLKVGDGAFTEVENRLNDLAADTSPWKSNARELIAVAALKAGKVDTARAALEQVLADPGAPAGVRNRAQVLLSGIVAKDMAAAPPAPAGADKK